MGAFSIRQLQNTMASNQRTPLASKRSSSRSRSHAVGYSAATSRYNRRVTTTRPIAKPDTVTSCRGFFIIISRLIVLCQSH